VEARYRTTEKYAVAGLGPATYVFPRRVRGLVKTWMPGTRPGKGCFGAKSGGKPRQKSAFEFPRTALRFRGNDE
jgi:hypothetical protein